jgi:hypothetical protein
MGSWQILRGLKYYQVKSQIKNIWLVIGKLSTLFKKIKIHPKENKNSQAQAYDSTTWEAEARRIPSSRPVWTMYRPRQQNKTKQNKTRKHQIPILPL